jgi:hypothetical protein
MNEPDESNVVGKGHVGDGAADLAILELALVERSGTARPPDLWPRVAARLAHDAKSGAAAAPRRRPWLAAAVVLLGVATVVAIAVRRDSDVPTLATTTDVPSSSDELADLRRHLATATEVTVHALAIWSTESQRWTAIDRHELDSLFRPGMRPRLDAATLRSLAQAIQSAVPASSGVAGAAFWTHELHVRTSIATSTLLLRGSDELPQRLAFRTPRGVTELLAPDLPRQAIEQVAAQAARATIKGLGLVIDERGFAEHADDTASLTLHDVPAQAVAGLGRFRSLRQLDLRHAPAWHDADILRTLADLQLSSLSLSPKYLAKEAYGTLAAMGSLRELFLSAAHPFHELLGQSASSRFANLGDDELRQLARLVNLRELLLVGSTCSDAGLAALAAIPLERLTLCGCEGVRGDRLAAHRDLIGLVLRNNSLAGEALAQCAQLPKLQRLGIFTSGADPLPLAELARAPALVELTLQGRLPIADLPLLAAVPQLRKLGLWPTPPMRLDDLEALRGLVRLERVGVVGLDARGRERLQAWLPGVTVTDELW